MTLPYPIPAGPFRSFRPLGSTPAVSLTQNMPSEGKASILLLGCGDARNILFTIFYEEDNGNGRYKSYNGGNY